MRLGTTWMAGLLRRRTARIVGQILGVTGTVTLAASLGTFFAASRARMTAQAYDAVPVDWQVQLAAGSNTSKLQQEIAAQPGVRSALSVGYADAAGFQA